MTGYYKQPGHVLIRPYLVVYSLIFFISGLFASCQPSPETSLSIRWEENRATGLSIPNCFIRSIAADSADQLLSVRLAGSETAIAGDYQRVGDNIIFEPLIPFTRGLHYTVWMEKKRLGELTIPAVNPGDRPTLLAIYPSQDSLPDNLLKIYLHFSRPMREGQSQKYVGLLKNRTDTLPGIFLDLQPELWNADRTLLTLWLDPGRIKRDLYPNKLLGAPLKPGMHYQLVVLAAWPDQQGASLGRNTTKSFLTVQRDSLSPNLAGWTIRQPESGSMAALDIAFGESLDYSLLTETLHVFTEAGQPVPGTWHVGDEEKRGFFKPDQPWKPGRYRLHIDSRLEDLAGNSMNRLFERDLTRQTNTVPEQPVTERYFNIPQTSRSQSFHLPASPTTTSFPVSISLYLY